MKHVFTNEKAVEAWFDRVTKCGPNDPSLGVSGSNILSRGRTLYSYGDHFPMVRWFPEQNIFLTNCSSRYSNSTSKHQNYVVRQMIRLKLDNCIEVGIALKSDPLVKPEDYITYWDACIYISLQQGSRSRKYKQAYADRVKILMADRNRFIKAFNLRAPELPEDVTAALVTLKLAA